MIVTVCLVGLGYFFLAIKSSLYLLQMLVTESHFSCRPSCKTYDTLKACLNLHVASLVAIWVFIVMCGQNESDDTRLSEFYLVSHLPEALL